MGINGWYAIIPAELKDGLGFYPKSKHIVVAHNNEFFTVKVISDSGVPMSQSQIFGCLRYITDKSASMGKNPHPVGILTSQKRDEWFKASEELKKAGNEASLREIETALFVLCLDGDLQDDTLPTDHKGRTLANAIHGCGSRFYTGNRWFDKIIQIFVCRSGENGMTIEHSTSEALAPMTIANHAVHCANGGNKFLEESCKECEVLPRHLPFLLNDSVKDHIQAAKIHADALIDDLEVEMLHFKSFGKSFIKSQRFSPDSFIQMAMQYAFYRIHKTPGAHYESGALRVFRHGRTDIIRSCSKESIEFAKSMLDDKADDNERMAAMMAAISGHNQYAKMTCDGNGVDRHLLGLKLIAGENNLEIPEFYSDFAYTVSTTHRISSSQVSGKAEMVVGFGPLVMDGYGCCYNIRDHDLLFGLSAMKSCTDTSVQQYKEALQESLHEMHNLAASRHQVAKL